MPIMTYNGKILRKPGGIASSPNCCCDQCQECCSKLVGGTYENGAWIFRVDSESSDDWMELSITGIGQDRLVCHGDVVTFTMSYHHSEESGEDNGHGESDANHQPTIRWDRAWEYTSHTPTPVGDDGRLIEAGELKYDSTQDVHTVTLELTFIGCEVGGEIQYGDVDISWLNDTLDLLLEFEDCPTEESTTCCEYTTDCNPCCYYIPVDEGQADSQRTRIMFWNTAGGFDVRVSILIDPDERVMYCSDDTNEIDIRVEVVPPPNYTGDDPDVCIFIEDWWPNALPVSGCEPPSDEDCSSGDDWYNGVSGFDNTVRYLSPDCDHECWRGPVLNGFQVTVSLDGETNVVVSTPELEPCDGLCCCDTYVPACTDGCIPCDLAYVSCDHSSPDDYPDIYYLENDYAEITDFEADIYYGGVYQYTIEQNDTSNLIAVCVEVSQSGCPSKYRYAGCYFLVPFIVTDARAGRTGLIGTETDLELYTPSYKITSGGVRYLAGWEAPNYNFGGIGGSYGGESDDTDCGGGSVSFEVGSSVMDATFTATGLISLGSEYRSASNKLQIYEGGTWRNVLASEVNMRCPDE